MEHAPSWYAASLPPELDRLRPRLEGDTVCDVCVIGGGFAGVSTAYHLAKAGQRVVLLDANRIGWGASGRNGGQIHPGFRRDFSWFASKMGDGVARQVASASKAALEHLDGLIAAHAPGCDRTHGLITACRTANDLREEISAGEEATAQFGATALTVLDEAETEAALGAKGHAGAVRDPDGGHLHPLRFVLRLADAAEAVGAQLYDGSKVEAVVPDVSHVSVRSSHGSVRASHVVLCGNGYMRGLYGDMDARVLPITNFIVATEPIGAGDAGGLLPTGEAASDTRFIVRYWRPTPDGRLLFGGGEKFSTAFPQDIAAFVRPHLLAIYPQLADVRIDHAWGGTLAVTQNRLPLVRRLDPRVTVAAGFSGQGVVNAPFAGKIIADALTHDPNLLDLFANFPCPAFPGGTALRAPILFLAMSWFALMDRIG